MFMVILSLVDIVGINTMEWYNGIVVIVGHSRTL